MTGRPKQPPRFYFSLRSPYSWIAYRDLTAGHPDLAGALEWRPFWEPDATSADALTEAGGDFPYVAMSREKHLYILQDVRRLTRARKLEMSWPLDRDPVWEVPHLAWFIAADAGLGREYVDRAYRARWQEGRDICDPVVIGELAIELGLPADRMAGAAQDAGLRARGVSALLDVHRDGVFGVPFFVHRYDKFWGTDRLAAFAEAVGSTRPAGPVDDQGAVGAPQFASRVMGSADGGHAGGCG
ncbi:2-hydroxychromene-2-carboxylate isomerase [Streptomyces albipurpureus]|uniref:2-hydroxychromene-2-carboxylate isomerase n=1 Tax=Streptomyces albipurpureus TaxID=2897419 RepID=A0ABT0UH37_9ACTN|nr:DsbA family protein [Streptomyces sp. CWNU-1]MCM2387943.1 DsbA family protein [Streptomyces sp. CWNU-1]